jgi:hypothetical protein
VSGPLDEVEEIAPPMEEPQPGSAEAQLQERFAAALRALPSLPELPMRQAWIAQTLEGLSELEAVFWLDQLIRGALWGHTAHMDAYMAAALWLIERGLADDYALLQRLFEAAHEEGREAVKFLLREAPPHQTLGEGAVLPEVRLPMGRPVSLGERRQIAVNAPRRLLERLLLDPSPMVIQRVLTNPGVRPVDVQVIVSRRPTTPELLVEVVRHPGWVRVHDLREALAMNPYNHTGIALRLLPTLHVRTLRRIRDAGDLHRAVKEFARLLVELRERRTAPLRV